jgi:hypothetical protein
MGESPEVKRGVQHHSLEPQQSQSEVTLEKSRSPGVIHAPIPTPPMDDMEPQSISFIGDCLYNWAVYNCAVMVPEICMLYIVCIMYLSIVRMEDQERGGWAVCITCSSHAMLSATVENKMSLL